MLSRWHCINCGLHNYSDDKNCRACFGEAQLSPIGEIMGAQTLLFAGFMRLRVLNHFMHAHQLQSTKIIPRDVINLCTKFYTLDIPSLLDTKIAELNVASCS